jgi:hypothetical protein
MFETQPHLPAKRPREESSPESDTEEDVNRPIMEEMDFQHTQHMTGTQALGDAEENRNYFHDELPPPLTPEHAALRADFQMINGRNMDKLFQRISADFKATHKKTTNQLQSQILSLNARISMLQGQVLAFQATAERTAEMPVAAPPAAKKDPKRKKEKQNANLTTASATGNNSATYAAVASAVSVTPTPTLQSTDTRGWTTLKTGGPKKIATPKLISTTYPKAEREVTCHFPLEKTDATPTQQDHTVR